MPAPSKKSIASAFPKLSAAQVAEIRSLMEHAHGKQFSAALAKIDTILGTHGVERIHLAKQNGTWATLHYANEGDTYNATIGYVKEPGFIQPNRRWVLLPGGWGSWLESMEHRGYRDYRDRDSY